MPLTPEQHRAIENFTITGMVKSAADAAGVHRMTLVRWRKTNPDFALAWEEAREGVVDLLEDEAFRRAVNGIDEPTFYRGEVVGSVKRYSDTLLGVLLRANAPEKYRENTKLELTGANNGPVQFDDSQAAARLAALLDAARQRKLASGQASTYGAIDEFA